MTLVKPEIDFEEITKEVKGVDLRRLTEKVRSGVEVFFGRGSVADAIASLNKKHTDEKKTREAAQEITLDNKTDDELIDLLNHNEELMRARALALIQKKIIDGVHSSDFVEKLKRQLPHIVKTLSTCKEPEVLLSSLIILKEVLNEEDVKNKFRDAGGMRPLGKLLLMPDLMENSGFVVILLDVISLLITTSENKENFRSVNGLFNLLPLLSHDMYAIVTLATVNLATLAELESNQVVIAKSHGTLRQIFINIQSMDYDVKLQSLKLLYNLSPCVTTRETFITSSSTIRTIFGFLDAEKIYNFQTIQDYNDNLQIQFIVLDLIYEIAVEERNQRALGQLGIMKLLDSYFSPLKTPSQKWNFEILVKVLKLTERLIQHVANRNIYIGEKSITFVVDIICKPHLFTEEVLLEAASIVTYVATQTTVKQQSYGKLGVQLLRKQLLPNFPTNEYIHELFSLMVSHVAASGLNNQTLLETGCDKVLMQFIRESKVDKVLKYSCTGLADFCTIDSKIVEAIVKNGIVPQLIALLGLGWSEINLSVARILAHVAVLGEYGLVEIVKHGGIVPLVKLLGDKSHVVKEQTLMTFGKILFTTKQQSIEYIGYFFDAFGDVPLLECITSNVEEVQVPALSILNVLTSYPENIEDLRDSGIEQKMKLLEKHPNVTKPGSQIAGFVKIISKNLKQEQINRRRMKAKQQAAIKEEKKFPIYWMKISCEHFCKVIPFRDTITFEDLQRLIETEFGITQWAEISLRNKEAEIAKINDQITLSYAVDCILKDLEVDFIVKPTKSVIPYVAETNKQSSAQNSKLDALLQRLNHRQLRLLIKDAIDQGIDITDPIKDYISLNRKIQKIPENIASGEPYGKGPTSNLKEQQPVAKVRNRRNNASKTGASTSGGPPPAPPPPPTIQIAKGKPQPKPKGNTPAAGESQDQLLTALKSKLEKDNMGLAKTLLDESEVKKRGQNQLEEVSLKTTLTEEELDKGPELWRYNLKEYAERLVEAFVDNKDIMNIAFEVVDSNQIEFEDAIQKMESPMDKNRLAQVMLECGFTVKSIVTTSDKTPSPVREYHSIICPIELPSYIIIKLTRNMLIANGGDKINLQETEEQSGGVVRGYWSKGASNTTTSSNPPNPTTTSHPTVPKEKAPVHQPTKKPPVVNAQVTTTSNPEEKPKPVVQGYWTRKEKPAEIIAAPLFDNDPPPAQKENKGPVIKGYWNNKKEQLNIKSIWDED
eukprot:TRINITY_DN18734_c0_g1_i1.p1 TRINITY_DN18734_c0_g1~~TRINITY_DN18734_c0_g1_i1.p1  ORF type:complete len:1224 (-),score=317.96 TRINITY_DN18734_c0_g1_i1:12-3683(-)